MLYHINNDLTDKVEFTEGTTWRTEATTSLSYPQGHIISKTGWYWIKCNTPSIVDVCRCAISNSATYVTILSTIIIPLKKGTKILIGGSSSYPMSVFEII